MDSQDKKKKRRTFVVQSISNDERLFEFAEDGTILFVNDIFADQELDLNFDLKPLDLPEISSIEEQSEMNIEEMLTSEQDLQQPPSMNRRQESVDSWSVDSVAPVNIRKELDDAWSALSQEPMRTPVSTFIPDTPDMQNVPPRKSSTSKSSLFTSLKSGIFKRRPSKTAKTPLTEKELDFEKMLVGYNHGVTIKVKLSQDSPY